VALEVQVVDLGADPPDGAPEAASQPKGDLSVIEPGVPLRVQVFQALEHERLNPVPVVGMQSRRQQHELFQSAAILDPLQT
jgi:hypothetical protein